VVCDRRGRFELAKSGRVSVDRTVGLFAEDAVFEFPYLPTIGLQRRFEGRRAIPSLIVLMGSHIPSFSISNVAIHDMKDASEIFVEYHVEGNFKDADQAHVQDYACQSAV
jgi:hypothetical protein